MIYFLLLVQKSPQCKGNKPFPSFLVPLFQNESKCEIFHMKMSSACSFIFMQIKVIFMRMVSHLDSLWNRSTRELGNGLSIAYAECFEGGWEEQWRGVHFGWNHKSDSTLRRFKQETKNEYFERKNSGKMFKPVELSTCQNRCFSVRIVVRLDGIFLQMWLLLTL